jgi:hypothetical protein
MPSVADLHVPIGTRVKLSLTDQGLKKLYKTIALLWEIPTEGLLQRAGRNFRSFPVRPLALTGGAPVALGIYGSFAIENYDLAILCVALVASATLLE